MLSYRNLSRYQFIFQGMANYTRWNSRLKIKPRKRKKRKEKSIKKLELKLRSVLYPIVKAEEPNRCVTCGKINMVGRDHQVGHAIKAELCNLIMRYNRKLLHPQCYLCNCWKRGNAVEVVAVSY